MMSEYLLSNTPLALLFAQPDLLKLDCLNLMTADLPVEMTEGLWYMQMWTLNSLLETKPILRNPFNKYLGKSRLLIFLLLFLVDLKQRGRNTRRKDNREVWNQVPLWLCFINIWYNPLPEWSFVWGNQAADVRPYLIATWQHVLLPCCVWHDAEAMFCIYSLVGRPGRIQKLQKWQKDLHWHSWLWFSLALSLSKEGTNAVFCHVTITWKILLLIFIIFQITECHPYRNIMFLY